MMLKYAISIWCLKLSSIWNYCMWYDICIQTFNTVINKDISKIFCKSMFQYLKTSLVTNSMELSGIWKKEILGR